MEGTSSCFPSTGSVVAEKLDPSTFVGNSAEAASAFRDALGEQLTVLRARFHGQRHKLAILPMDYL